MKSTRLTSKAASSTVDTDNTGGQIPGVPEGPPCSDPESRGRMSREGLYAGVPRPRQVSLGQERPQGHGRPGGVSQAGGVVQVVTVPGAGPFRGVAQAGGGPVPGLGPRPGPFQREDRVRGGAQAGGVAQAIPGAGPGRPRRRTWR